MIKIAMKTQHIPIGKLVINSMDIENNTPLADRIYNFFFNQQFLTSSLSQPKNLSSNKFFYEFYKFLQSKPEYLTVKARNDAIHRFKQFLRIIGSYSSVASEVKNFNWFRKGVVSVPTRFSYKRPWLIKIKKTFFLRYIKLNNQLNLDKNDKFIWNNKYLNLEWRDSEVEHFGSFRGQPVFYEQPADEFDLLKDFLYEPGSARWFLHQFSKARKRTKKLDLVSEWFNGCKIRRSINTKNFLNLRYYYYNSTFFRLLYEKYKNTNA